MEPLDRKVEYIDSGGTVSGGQLSEDVAKSANETATGEEFAVQTSNRPKI